MRFPKKKWGMLEESPTRKAEKPEEVIQQFADEYLALKRLKCIRIPDNVWNWVYGFAPEWFKIYMAKIFGGIPDNVILTPLNDRYALCLLMENKTQDKKGRAVGKLHGKQKNWAEALPVQIARSEKDVMALVERLENDVAVYARLINDDTSKEVSDGKA